MTHSRGFSGKTCRTQDRLDTVPHHTVLASGELASSLKALLSGSSKPELWLRARAFQESLRASCMSGSAV